MTNDDMELVRVYAASRSESAFATLVARHTNLVYSAALRQTRDPQLAKEVTQAVFIILARKAGSLSAKTILSGWLFRTACYVSASALKQERRRLNREQEAFMQSTLHETDATWEQLAPLLDDAMLRLGATDRDALVLRYFENKTLPEVGAALGLEQRAAQKRVVRAVEKLKRIFSQRGVTLTATAIIAAVSANSIQAAPVGLVKTISAVVVAKGAAATTSTSTLIKGALKIMAWTKAKMAVAVGIGVLLAAGTTTVVVEKVLQPKLSSTDLSWTNDPKYWAMDSRVLNRLPSVLIVRPTRFPNTGGSISTGQRAIGINISMENLLGDAYSSDSVRMVVNTPLPAGKFDFMMTPPYKPWTPLQGELKKQFGLTAHRENRQMNVLQLKIKDGQSPLFKPAASGNTGMSSMDGEMKMENQPVSTLANWLEGYFDMPITDHTSLRERYDLTLKWKNNRGPTDSAERDRIQQALIDQLGLELVPGRESINMLVVEQAP